MKIWTSIAVFGFLVVGTFIPQCLKDRGPVVLDLGDRADPLPVLSYLVEVGKEYDRFFTIEEAWRQDDLSDSIVNHWLQRSLQKSGVKEELEQLQASVPNLAYDLDKMNPKIIHIADRRLAEQKDYALEGIIKSIDFTGKVHDLVTQINHQGIPVSSPLITFNNETLDYDTVVRVKGEGLKVRDALSNFIELGGRRSRILWIARTKLGQREVSYVRYP